MSVKWRNRIDLPGFSDASPDDFRRFAKLLGEGLPLAVREFDHDEELSELAFSFSEIARDGSATVNDFDNQLEELYAWGDVGKRLWVDTFEVEKR